MKICRSFTRKINLGNYETADFYCEAGDEDIGQDSGLESGGDLSEILHQFCKEEVEKSIQEFLKEREPKVINKIEPKANDAIRKEIQLP